MTSGRQMKCHVSPTPLLHLSLCPWAAVWGGLSQPQGKAGLREAKAQPSFLQDLLGQAEAHPLLGDLTPGTVGCSGTKPGPLP